MAGAPPVGRRARTTRATPSNYVRATLLFGAHSSSRLLVASVLRQLCHIDHSIAELHKPHLSELFAPRSASILHCTSSRAASTSPKIARQTVLFFLHFGAEAYARRATDKHTEINPPQDHRRGKRLLREPIGPSACIHFCCRSQTDLRGTPLDYGHRALGAHVDAPSLWSSLGRNRRCW